MYRAKNFLLFYRELRLTIRLTLSLSLATPFLSHGAKVMRLCDMDKFLKGIPTKLKGRDISKFLDPAKVFTPSKFDEDNIDSAFHKMIRSMGTSIRPNDEYPSGGYEVRVQTCTLKPAIITFKVLKIPAGDKSRFRYVVTRETPKGATCLEAIFKKGGNGLILPTEKPKDLNAHISQINGILGHCMPKHSITFFNAIAKGIGSKKGSLEDNAITSCVGANGVSYTFSRRVIDPLYFGGSFYGNFGYSKVRNFNELKTLVGKLRKKRFVEIFFEEGVYYNSKCRNIMNPSDLEKLYTPVRKQAIQSIAINLFGYDPTTKQKDQVKTLLNMTTKDFFADVRKVLYSKPPYASDNGIKKEKCEIYGKFYNKLDLNEQNSFLLAAGLLGRQEDGSWSKYVRMAQESMKDVIDLTKNVRNPWLED